MYNKRARRFRVLLALLALVLYAHSSSRYSRHAPLFVVCCCFSMMYRSRALVRQRRLRRRCGAMIRGGEEQDDGSATLTAAPRPAPISRFRDYARCHSFSTPFLLGVLVMAGVGWLELRLRSGIMYLWKHHRRSIGRGRFRCARD